MANYKSNYTGAEIDGTVTKLIDIPQEPTEEHIGKVIGVVEGESEAKGANPKYGLVPMGGGSEDFVVTFSGRSALQSNTATCDKTGDEILTAIEAGKNIRFRYHFTDGYFDKDYDLVLMYEYNREQAQLYSIDGTYTSFVILAGNTPPVPTMEFSVRCGWNYELNSCYCMYYSDQD